MMAGMAEEGFAGGSHVKTERTWYTIEHDEKKLRKNAPSSYLAQMGEKKKIDGGGGDAGASIDFYEVVVERLWNKYGQRWK